MEQLAILRSTIQIHTRRDLYGRSLLHMQTCDTLGRTENVNRNRDNGDTSAKKIHYRHGMPQDRYAERKEKLGVPFLFRHIISFSQCESQLF